MSSLHPLLAPILLVLACLPTAAQLPAPCVEVSHERIEHITNPDGSVHLNYAATIQNLAPWPTGTIMLAPLAPGGTVIETMTFPPRANLQQRREVDTGIDVPATGAGHSLRLLVIIHSIDFSECCSIEHEIKLAPRPPKAPLSIRATPEGIRLRFEATPTMQCCVQRSPDLSPGSWETFEIIHGVGQEVDLPVGEGPGTGGGFYRLLLLE